MWHRFLIDKKYILSQLVILIRLKKYMKKILFLFFGGSYFQNELLKNSTGTTAVGIQRQKLERITVCYSTRKARTDQL